METNQSEFFKGAFYHSFFSDLAKELSKRTIKIISKTLE
jgi:hypothetical protein